MDRVISLGVTLEKRLKVDTIRLSVQLDEQLPTREECEQHFTALMAEVRSLLEQGGLAADALKDEYFRVQQHVEHLYKKQGGNYYVATTELRGYEYQAEASMTCAYSQENAAKLWSALRECGDAVEYYMDFFVADKEAAQEELAAEAVREGCKKAVLLAASAGMKIEGIASIDYEYRGANGRCHDRDIMCCKAMDCPDGALAPEFHPQDEVVRAHVDMQWKMC